MNSHFSGRANDLSKAHYFFTEVERVTENILSLAKFAITKSAYSHACISRERRWMPGALAPARSSCRRCSLNTASSRHLTFAITNLLVTDVDMAGRDTPHPDVAYLQMGDSVNQSDVGYTWKCEDNFVPDGLGQLSRGFSDLLRGCTRLLPREDLLALNHSRLVWGSAFRGGLPLGYARIG